MSRLDIMSFHFLLVFFELRSVLFSMHEERDCSLCKQVKCAITEIVHKKVKAPMRINF